jgi:hypothetical protein
MFSFVEDIKKERGKEKEKKEIRGGSEPNDCLVYPSKLCLFLL